MNDIAIIALSTISITTIIAGLWDLHREVRDNQDANLRAIRQQINRHVVSSSDRAARRFVEGA